MTDPEMSRQFTFNETGAYTSGGHFRSLNGTNAKLKTLFNQINSSSYNTIVISNIALVSWGDAKNESVVLKVLDSSNNVLGTSKPTSLNVPTRTELLFEFESPAFVKSNCEAIKFITYDATNQSSIKAIGTEGF